LIRGETGTGKELLARMVHGLSSRRDKPWVAVNCAALPESLIESELFGHERGAFTGASSRRIGRFEQADGGTLFIDEVGDLPPEIQVKLLRVLQEGTVERVGSNKPIRIDVRIVTATHRDLEELIGSKRFREDLFYRLNVVPIFVPPLRDRPEDIWPITLHFLDEIQGRMGKNDICIGDTLRKSMIKYDWPGNVREVINVVERIVALTDSGGEATSGSIPLGRKSRPKAPAANFAGNLKDMVGTYERGLIIDALEANDGNASQAARMLGVSRQTLWVKMSKYGIEASGGTTDSRKLAM